MKTHRSDPTTFDHIRWSRSTISRGKHRKLFYHNPGAQVANIARATAIPLSTCGHHPHNHLHNANNVVTIVTVWKITNIHVKR